MSAGSDVYLCVSIDCECDKGPGWKTQKPLAFSGIAQGIGERLQPLFRCFGTKATYLLSPEVIRDARSAELLAGLEMEADLGAHLHGEFAEPEAFEPDVTSVFQCHYDRDTEREKLRYLTSLFRSTFLAPPRSFRAGRFGIGRNSLGLLEDLGYTVDSSVTPHKSWASAGATESSFRRAPTQPYWPVLETPEKVAVAPSRLLEVPVTIRPSAASMLPLLNRVVEPRWLRPTKGSVGRLIALVEDEIAAHQGSGRPIVLNCMFHNVEIVPGLSPYAANAAEADAILGRLAGLLDFAVKEGIRTVGLSDVPDLFQ